MMGNENWEIQNKLYQLKERERILESNIDEVRESKNFIINFKLFSKPDHMNWLKWAATCSLFLILNLDKVFYYHYMKFTSLREAKKLESLLIQTRKEIEYYENCS